MLGLFDFRLWEGRPSERELDNRQVFTPPRDDFAGLAAYGANTPMTQHHQRLHNTLVTRQACCLLFRATCFFLCSLVTMSLAYTLVNMAVGEAKVLHCKKQRIKHGVILPGHVNSPAKVKCDANYTLGAPIMGIRCRMVSERCVIEKHATVMKEAVQKCDREYAFVSKKIEEKVLLNSSETMDLIDSVEEDAIPHACMSNEELGLRASRLYGEQMPRAHPPTGATVMSASSIAAVAALVLFPLALLVTSGITHGRASLGVKRGRGPPDPPSAVGDVMLLDTEDRGFEWPVPHTHLKEASAQTREYGEQGALY